MLNDDAVAEDEALVFFIDEYEGEQCITIVEDDATVDRVFNVYYQLLRENGLIPDDSNE